MAKLAQYILDLPKTNNNTPDFLSQYIQDFARPNINTPDEWADFYLEKMTPLRYKVGMQFCNEDQEMTTVTYIDDKCIVMHTGDIVRKISKQFGPFFEYKGFEACAGLQWFNLVGDINSFGKRYLLTNVLSHKYMIDLFNSHCDIYERYQYILPVPDSSFTEDFEALGYAAWGKRITG